MENAISDGTDSEEREDGEYEGVKEIEDGEFNGEDGGILFKEAAVGFNGGREVSIDEGING